MYLRLAVMIADDDGVPVADVLQRGLLDLKLRLAHRHLKRKEYTRNGVEN